MVIKWSLGGESAFGDQPASSMSKFSAAVNSGLGNGSFWIKIHDAMHVDQCSSISTRVWSHLLTSDLTRCLLFWKCLQRSCLKEVSVPSFVVGGLRVSTAISDSFTSSLCVCAKKKNDTLHWVNTPTLDNCFGLLGQHQQGAECEPLQSQPLNNSNAQHPLLVGAS